ncbi:MAG: TIGR04076 family protein [Candidatus Bipolaricaulota bacterium]
MPRVRITVVKRAVHAELVDAWVRKERYPQGFGACSLFTEGQSFDVDGFPKKPADFPCDWAWVDIQRDVAMLLFGADPPWMAQPGTAVVCCSDGLRPVSFLIERVDT